VQHLLAPSFGLAERIEEVARIGRPFGWTAIGCAGLFERCARLLGDRWQQEACSDLEVTLALGTLQAALHTMRSAPTASSDALDEAPKVLVATLPAEPHRLGVALDCEVLRLAGWRVANDDVDNVDDLQRLVGDQWLDALDLSLSAVFRREHWLPRLADTIASLRAASQNPKLVVIVGGRLFAEDRDSWITVGADAASASAADLPASIALALRQARIQWSAQPRMVS
jgi:methanogenic corrinoid protein MtbC1